MLVGRGEIQNGRTVETRSDEQSRDHITRVSRQDLNHDRVTRVQIIDEETSASPKLFFSPPSRDVSTVSLTFCLGAALPASPRTVAQTKAKSTLCRKKKKVELEFLLSVNEI